MPVDLAAIEAERSRIRTDYLMGADHRPPSSARGVHHIFFDIGDGNLLAFFDFPAASTSARTRRCSAAIPTVRDWS